MGSEAAKKTTGRRRGRPTVRELIDALRTRTWLAFLRWETGNWEHAYTIALLVERHLCRRSATGAWVIPRQWNRYELGALGVSDERLARAEALVPGSTRLYHHPFWGLLRAALPPRAVLIGIIRQLPPRYVRRLLDDPVDLTGDVNVHRNLCANDVAAVRDLGSLDALAALFACSLLLGDDRRARIFQQATMRLFLHITERQPFAMQAYEIWRLAQPRYFAALVDGEYQSWVRLANEVQDVLTAGARFELVRHHPQGLCALLARAEQMGFSAIASEAFEHDLARSSGEPCPKPGPLLAEFVRSMRWDCAGRGWMNPPNSRELDAALRALTRERETRLKAPRRRPDTRVDRRRRPSLGSTASLAH